jgi:hypothetical protein
MAEVAIAVEERKKRQRSPAYPFINLETALKRAREFYSQETRGAAYLKVAAKHWGYEEKSSGGLQTAAALIGFGLMRDEGTGDKRKLQLTPSALRILLDSRNESLERVEAIKQAALTPKIHAELWKRFGPTTSNEQLRHTLILDWEPPFNENTVDGFIKEYRDTIAFAKLVESDIVSTEVIDNGDKDGTRTPYVPKIGDWVQWEHNGVLGLTEATQIKGFSPDREWVYVNSQNGAVPTRELILESAPVKPLAQSEVSTGQHQPSPPKTLMLEFVVPLSDGKAVFQWPSTLSKEDVEDLKDSLKMMERKISRAVEAAKTD